MHVTVTYNANLSDSEVQSVVDRYLAAITKERFVRHGKLMEEVYTSHRFDSECDDQTDVKLVETIHTLQQLLKERKK